MPLSVRHLALPAALVLALLGARSARAEEPRKDPDEPTRYSFEDDKILADTIGPMGEVMMIRKRGQRGSLIRARESYVAELLHSVEAL